MKGDDATSTARHLLQRQPIQQHIIEELRVKTNNGFFGLDELHEYFANEVEPIAKEAGKGGTVVLDFSEVRTWDLSAMLWLVVALDHYRGSRGKKGLNLKLRLPEKPRASVDFLKRWNFFGALKNLADDPPCELLVDAQRDYFKARPMGFYNYSGKAADYILMYLHSQELAEIKNLADVFIPAERRRIDNSFAGRYRRTFIESKLGFVLHLRCRIPKRIASLVSRQIINEAILNVQEHPNASIGMVALGVVKDPDRLILAIADNGEPIPKTIYQHYRWSKSQGSHKKQHSLPTEYSGEDFSGELKADIITHATQPRTSRKIMEWLEEKRFRGHQAEAWHAIGMGLHYIRRDATGDQLLKGEFTIVSDGVRVKYDNPLRKEFSDQPIAYNVAWPGNLLQVAVPLNGQG